MKKRGATISGQGSSEGEGQQCGQRILAFERFGPRITIRPEHWFGSSGQASRSSGLTGLIRAGLPTRRPSGLRKRGSGCSARRASAVSWGPSNPGRYR
jgi:hypothetical protein